MSLSDCIAKLNSGKPVFDAEEIKRINALTNQNIGKMSADDAARHAVQTLLDAAIAERHAISNSIKEAMGLPVESTAELPLTLSAQSQEKTDTPTTQAGMFTPDGRATVAVQSGNISSVPKFNNASGDFNPDLDPIWINKGRKEIQGDGMSDAEYNAAIAEYANQWRVDSLLEELGFKKRGSSNISSSTYYEKQVGIGEYDQEYKAYDKYDTYEIRVSDHSDRHSVDDLIKSRTQLNFRTESANWSDVDISPDMSSVDAIQAIKDSLPQEALSNKSIALVNIDNKLKSATPTQQAEPKPVMPPGSTQPKIGGYPVSGLGDKALTAYLQSSNESDKVAAQAEIDRRVSAKKPDPVTPQVDAPKFSQSAPASSPITRERATQKLEAILGEKLTKVLTEAGIIRLVGSEKELTDNVGVLFSKTLDQTTYWHGSASGDLRGGSSGLHLGTKEAARQALEARIGIPATGEWDGTREYGKTLLAGRETQHRLNKEEGRNTGTGANVGAPEHDYYPTDRWTASTAFLKYADGSPMPMDVKPNILPYKLDTEMTNTRDLTLGDTKANASMRANLTKGVAKRGFYYTNIGEDEGSISVVVPNGKHVVEVKFSLSDHKIKGVTYPDGRIELVVGNIAESEFDGIALHEAIHSQLKNFLGAETYAQLEKQFGVFRKLADSQIKSGGKLNTWFEQARAAIPYDTRDADILQEQMAYAVEQHSNGTKQPNIITRWVEKFLSALRQAIIKHMPSGKLKNWALVNIKPADLAAFAVAGMKARGREVAAGNMTSDAEIRGLVAQYSSTESPNQVKSAIGNLGTFSDRNNILFSQTRDWYYSQLSDVIRTIPAKVNTGNMISMWLQANAAKMGVKADELKWSGVLDYLAIRGKEKTGVDDVLAYLQTNGVTVKDVVLGEGGERLLTSRDVEITEDGDEFWEAWVPGQSRTIGKKHYPTKEAAIDFALRYFNGHIEARNKEKNNTKFATYVVPGGSSYKELLITLPAPSTLAEPGFRSSHYDQPNILVHIRFDTRTGANGEKIMMLQEIQSDYAAAGKKDGFTNKSAEQIRIESAIRAREIKAFDKSAYDRKIKEYQWDGGVDEGARNLAYKLSDAIAAGKNLKEKYGLGFTADTLTYDPQDGHIGGGGYFPSGLLPYELIDAQKKALAEDKKLHELKAELKAIPSAPFVESTNSYVALALRRAISYAVNNGFDAVVWANGEQNAAHYDLSKQISRVGYTKNGRLLAYDKNSGNAVIDQEMQESEIADHIGKDAAEKLLNAKPNTSLTGSPRVIQGEGLKVGGEGMAKFYDAIIPQGASKIIKKYGGKVESIASDTVGASKDKDGNAYQDQTQQMFTITPALRTQVENKGMPLFSERKAKEENNQTVESVTRATAKLRASWVGFQRIKIVQSVKDIPNEIYLKSLRALTPIDQGTEGIYDPSTKTVYLIADNIATPERSVWVAAHEVVGHGGLRMLGGTVAESINHAAKNGYISQLAKAIAVDRKETFDAKAHVDEAIAELAAAIITGNTDAILERYKIKVPMGMRSNLMGIIKRVVDAVRNFIAKMSGKLIDHVSDGEVLDLIHQMQAKVEGRSGEIQSGGFAMASKAQQVVSDLVNAFKELGKYDETAIYKTSNKNDMQGIADDISDKIKIDDHQISPERYVEEGVMGYRDKWSSWRIKAPDGKPVYATANLVDKTIYINASELKEGQSDGAAIYQLVGQYAHNNGLVFIGDPYGISNGAIYRRAENMIALAIRAGNTDSMRPHPDQLKAYNGTRNGEEFYWPGMKWKEGDSEFNLNSMLMAVYSVISHHVPEIKNVIYDINTKVFRDTRTGREFSEADFGILAKSAGARKAYAGRTTLQRSALAESVVSGKISGPVWSQFLAGLSGEGMGRGFDGTSLSKLRYSRAPSDQGGVGELPEGRKVPSDSAGKSFLREGGTQPVVKEQPRILRMAKKATMEQDTSMLDHALGGKFAFHLADTILTKTGAKSLASGVYTNLLERVGAESFADLIPETVKAGLVSDYGLTPEYQDRKAEMKAAEAAQNRKSAGMVEMLAGLTRNESRVAYQWMQEKPDTQTEAILMDQLPKESREVLGKLKDLISSLGEEAVRLGQLSPEAFERNNMAYVNRSYAKHVIGTEGKIAKFMRGRAMKIKGNQYKGRGIFDEVTMKEVSGDPMFWRKLQQGRADNSLVGEKLVRYERRDASTEVMDALPGMESKPLGKLREVVYWPVSQAVPVKFGSWVDAGTFEVRGTKGDKLVVWRDFTREERTRMGELDEVRYAVAQTLQMMTHDIEMGRFFEWNAKQYGKLEIPAGGEDVKASEAMYNTFGKNDWVQVPSISISKTTTKKYGALAGLYVPGPVWNDLRQVGGLKFDNPILSAHESVLQFWKKAKTGWSPAVHMNNVMANFVMADWHDLKSADLAEGLKVWALKNKPGYKEIYQRFEDSGALGGMFLSNEALRDEIAKQLETMKDELTGAQADTELSRLSKVMHLVTMAGMVPVKGAKLYSEKMGDAYQFEDAVFRLASFTKAIRYGKTDIEAGRIARHSFLNYDINAPWVQMARHSALPFISFFYRALPMALDTVKNKPWKIVKLLAFYQLASMIGSMMAGGDDDEEKKRKLLPDEKSGRIWGIVPKMIRMPWNDKDNNPIYLDVRRWVPVGDVVDTGQSASDLPSWATPGGPLVMLAEVFLANKSIFTRKDITKETDNFTEAAEKKLDYLFKGMLPSVPLPNPLNMQIGGISFNPLNLEQGSFQPYAWSGIEKAVDRKEGKIGEVRSTPQAIAGAFGIKVAAYPEANMKAAIGLQFQAAAKEIEGEMKKDARDYGKLENPTPAQKAAMERGMKRNTEKLNELAVKVRERVN